MDLRTSPYQAPSSAASVDTAVAGFIRRVFMWMAAGLIVTGATAFAVTASPGLWPILFTSPTVWIVMFAPLAIVLAMSFLGERINATASAGLFLLLSFLYGLTFSAILLIYTGASVARAFFIAAGMFGAMALFGMVTKRDLSGVGSFMMMGLIGVVIASVVNIWLASDGVSWVVSLLSVVIFSGLTAWEMQSLKQFAYARASEGGTELVRKAAVHGALSLYLSFINLFMAILRLSGDRR